MKILEVVHVN